MIGKSLKIKRWSKSLEDKGKRRGVFEWKKRSIGIEEKRGEGGECVRDNLPISLIILNL